MCWGRQTWGQLWFRPVCSFSLLRGCLFPRKVSDTLILPPVWKAPQMCTRSLAQVGWEWEMGSWPRPGNGPVALLLMKGVNLQHRQVLGRGRIPGPFITCWKCYSWESQGQSCTVFLDCCLLRTEDLMQPPDGTIDRERLPHLT